MFKALKAWITYLGFFLTGRLDELADPRVKINQAIAAETKRNADLEKAAIQVIAGRNMVRQNLEKAKKEVEQLEGEALTALRLADKAEREGNAAEAEHYAHLAESRAQELSRREDDVIALESDLALAEDQAKEAGQLAKTAQQNVKDLQSQRQQLLREHNSVVMREKANAAMRQMQGMEAGQTASLDKIRTSIQERGARAQADAEVVSQSDASHSATLRDAVRQESGVSRLRKLREDNGMGVSMAKEDRLR